MVFDQHNEIKGGSRNGRDAWVFYDRWGGSITEMTSSIADGYNYSMFYRSMIVSGLWDKTQTFEEIEEKICGNLCEDAKRALFSANIRGVKIVIYWHDKEFEDKALNALELYKRYDNLPQKEWEKVQKILNKYSN